MLFFQNLHNYRDWQIPFFIKFGFPLDDINCEIFSDQINHESVTLFPNPIDHYLKDEIKHGSTLGPFHQPPFKLNTSLL